MSIADRVINASTVLIAICAVTITGLLVRREFFAGKANINQQQALGPIDQPDWQSYAVHGHALGDDNATVTIVEFADFECPFCRRFHTYVDSLESLGSSLRILYRHFPLSNHKFAVPAVRASECAAAQGRFAEMHNALYAYPDSIGVAPWWWFGQSAGVADSVAFTECVKSNAPIPALSRDTADARRLNVTGTPTLLIGPYRFNGVPHFDTLKAYVDNAAALSRRSDR